MRAIKENDFFKENIIWFFLLFFIFSLTSYYYLCLRFNFFDDVFIYLHIAKNAVESSTWQYFPLVDRPSLLASSPLRILLLTISSYICSLFGLDGRNLIIAKIILLLSGVLTLIIWLPFWKEKYKEYFFLGIIYFLLSLSINTILDFEGGLLLCWIATLIMFLQNIDLNQHKIAFLVPLGLLIRPDISLPSIILLFIYLGFTGNIYRIHKRVLSYSTLLFAIWSLISIYFKVYPLPITYWAKSSLATLFENKYMLSVFFERLGMISVQRGIKSQEVFILIGILIIFSFLIVFIRGKISKFLFFIGILNFGFIFLKSPANYWWYYENFLVTLIGFSFGYWVIDSNKDNRLLSGGYVLVLLLFITLGKSFTDGPNLWSFSHPSRAQGYKYLSEHSIGNGAYFLDGVGKVFVRNPEIGITSYFTGKKAWIYDMGGLAQPLSIDKVQNSFLRFFYPDKL